MRKQKEQPTLTHAEIINYAIQGITRMVKQEQEMNKRLKETNPDMMMDLWTNKLKTLLYLYKLETGNDFCLEFDIE